VGQLVADGYEIKSVVLNNGKYVVFLQKERRAFACEFSKVNKSRCGEIK
jgi:beta-galactosidase beta subunit